MGVYIKDMEMPTSCNACELAALVDISDGIAYGCRALKEMIYNDRERLPNCPLVPIPPHGRLIDADKLLASFKESIDECHKWANEVPNDTMFYARVSQALGTFVECALRTKGMPTVIPADKDGET